MHPAADDRDVSQSALLFAPHSYSNPVKYFDPDGHTPRCPTDLGCRSRNYDPDSSVRQAWSIIKNWFFETGKDRQVFTIYDSLTLDVKSDPQMLQFRKEWEDSGFALPFESSGSIDERNEGSLFSRLIRGAGTWFRNHVVNLGLSTFGLGSNDADGLIDPVGGSIGSFDRISAMSDGNGRVNFTVTNEMGWASGTRVPGTNYSVLQNRTRDQRGPGGTITQIFTWSEPAPRSHLIR
jgi:hypothetical protein